MKTHLLRVKSASLGGSCPAGGVALLLTILSLAGCSGDTGPKRAAIAGNVTVNGAPLKAGHIVFVPIEPQGPAATAAVVDGAYKLPSQQGPLVGRHRVEVQADRGIPPDDEAAFAEWQKNPPPVVVIPPHFSSQSTLVADVQDTENVFNVAVVNGQ